MVTMDKIIERKPDKGNIIQGMTEFLYVCACVFM